MLPDDLSFSLRCFVYLLILAHVIAFGAWVLMLRKNWTTTEDRLQRPSRKKDA